jgi:hypothetical protein
MRRVRIPQLLRGHMVMFANEGGFATNWGVAKKPLQISRATP